ncbi:MAG: GNAT family N-acetyltransferase [Breznakibacter sp.]
MMLHLDEITVRPIEPGDAESYFEIFSHPDVARYDDFTPITREELVTDMARIEKYTPQSSFLELAVSILPSNKMVGIITIDKKRKYTYLGYHFNPAYHGKGLAIRSVRMFVQSLSDIEAYKLRVVTHPDNKASILLALKLGFSFLKNRTRKGILESVYRFDKRKWNELSAMTPSAHRSHTAAWRDSNTLANYH